MSSDSYCVTDFGPITGHKGVFLAYSSKRGWLVSTTIRTVSSTHWIEGRALDDHYLSFLLSLDCLLDLSFHFQLVECYRTVRSSSEFESLSSGDPLF